MHHVLHHSKLSYRRRVGCALQDLFLGVDGLSTVQWHPYSTVGGPRPHTLVAHIKSYGAWTSGLMHQLLRDGSVTMRIDGPYGEFEERPEWTRHRTLAIFAGGIGVRALLQWELQSSIVKQ